MQGLSELVVLAAAMGYALPRPARLARADSSTDGQTAEPRVLTPKGVVAPTNTSTLPWMYNGTSVGHVLEHHTCGGGPILGLHRRSCGLSRRCVCGWHA